MKPKVLTFVPVYPYFPEEAFKAATSQTFKGENDVVLSLFDPYPTNNPSWGRNLAFKHNKARQMAILHEYTHLFLVESDVIVPDNALELLLGLNESVCCGWYRLNHGELAGKTTVMIRMSDSIPPDTYTRTRHLEPDNELPGAFKPGEILGLDMCILGCTLIRTSFLLDFKFDTGIDASFSRYCIEHDIPMICHTGVYCKHLNLREHIK